MIRRDTAFFFQKDSFYPIHLLEEIDSEKSLVYEVMRVMHGKILFLNDHILRLQKSISLTYFLSNFDSNALISNLNQLLMKNKFENGNIMLLAEMIDSELQFKAFYIQHSYPTAAMYEKGVDLKMLFAERQNPNAKVSNQDTRKAANTLISNEHIFESLLVNRFGQITEGSRSNFFYIRENSLFTAPLSMVLGGIIRKKVIELIIEMGYSFNENALNSKELHTIDACFLTGTSLHILPIKTIDSQQFNPKHPSIVKLKHAFASKHMNHNL